MTNFKADHIWKLLLGGNGDTLPESLSVNLFMAVPTIYAKLLQYYEQHMAQSDYNRNFVKATCEQKIR